jgi:opacity protein-like surface antigen
MKRFLLAAVAACCLSAPASADVVADLGINPTSATGSFNHSLGALVGAFDNQLTFQLIGAPQFVTIASVTNVFPSAGDFITGFTGAVFNTVDGIIGNGNDLAVIGPVAATLGCGIGSDICQGFAGAALLDAGAYYLDISGTAGGSSGYGGNLAVAAVPGPVAGAGIPGILAGGLALIGLMRRRRKV